MCEKKVMFY